MAETTATIIKMTSPRQAARDARCYTEPKVKRILKAYTKSYDRVRRLKPWPEEETERFIETAFDFD